MVPRIANELNRYVYCTNSLTQGFTKVIHISEGFGKLFTVARSRACTVGGLLHASHNVARDCRINAHTEILKHSRAEVNARRSENAGADAPLRLPARGN